MEAIIQKQTVKLELIILMIVMAIVLAGYIAVVTPHYLPASKIEEGTIVVRDDSVTTIVIPDKR